MVRETFLHFHRGLEPRFAAGDFGFTLSASEGRGNGRKQAARADGVHGAMMQMLLRPEEVHVIRCYQCDAEFATEALRRAQRSPIARR